MSTKITGFVFLSLEDVLEVKNAVVELVENTIQTGHFSRLNDLQELNLLDISVTIKKLRLPLKIWSSRFQRLSDIES